MVTLACSHCSEEIHFSKNELMNLLKGAYPEGKEFSEYLEQKAPVPIKCPGCGRDDSVLVHVIEREFD